MSITARIASLFRAQRRSAAEVYSRIIKKCFLDGIDITDDETVELFSAMQAADIPEDQFHRHQETLRRLVEARKIAAKNADARAELPAAEAALTKAQQKVQTLMDRELRPAEQRVEAINSAIISTCNSDVHSLEANVERILSDPASEILDHVQTNYGEPGVRKLQLGGGGRV